VKWSVPDQIVKCGAVSRKFPFPVLDLTSMAFQRECSPSETIVSSSGMEFVEQQLPINSFSFVLPHPQVYNSFMDSTSDNVDAMLSPDVEDIPLVVFQSYRPSERWSVHLHNNRLYFSRSETGILEMVADLKWELVRADVTLPDRYAENALVPYHEIRGSLTAVHYTGRESDSCDMFHLADWLVKALALGRTGTPHRFPQRFRKQHPDAATAPLHRLVEYSWLMYGSQGVFGAWDKTLRIDTESNWEDQILQDAEG